MEEISVLEKEVRAGHEQVQKLVNEDLENLNKMMNESGVPHIVVVPAAGGGRRGRGEGNRESRRCEVARCCEFPRGTQRADLAVAGLRLWVVRRPIVRRKRDVPERWIGDGKFKANLAAAFFAIADVGDDAFLDGFRLQVFERDSLTFLYRGFQKH